MSTKPHSPLPTPHSLIFALVYFIFGLTANAQTAAIRYAMMPEQPRPGEPVTIGVSDAAGARFAVLVRDGKRLTKAAFFSIPAESAAQDEPAEGTASGTGQRSFLAAVLTIPSTLKPGTAAISVEGTRGVVSEIAITITGREFISEVIELNAALSGIRTDPDPQKTAESNHLWGILNKTGKEVYCLGNFSPPVSSTRRTSFYGDRRVYQYANGSNDTSVHAGVDYGVPTGTEVSACGPGKVVLARYRIVTGNSVILEHLPGVYSLYYHLDSIAVAEGAMVDAGTLLGKSGATGLATGPHLHWEIRVFGENTDPDAFIARPILDKDAILSKLYQ